MKKVLLNGLSIFFILIVILALNGCNSDSSTPVSGNTYDANSINGTITFVDTAMITDTLNGYYNVSAFATWPPTGNASASAKIKPIFMNGKYTATFKIVVPSDGSYTITSAFIRIPYVPGMSVLGLGVYDTIPGNDTTHNNAIIFGNHPKAIISGGTGIGNINFNSWIDTSKKIYKF